MVLTSLVTGFYKPTYNVWGPPIVWIYVYTMLHGIFAYKTKPFLGVKVDRFSMEHLGYIRREDDGSSVSGHTDTPFSLAGHVINIPAGIATLSNLMSSQGRSK